MASWILGTHSGHNSSACLLNDNRVVCAIEKERLTRKKNDSGDPIECVEYVLKSAEINYQAVDLVVRSNWYDSKELSNEYYKRFRNTLNLLPHHLLHAYASSICCIDEPYLIFIMDGRGCRPQDNNETRLSGDNLFETESVFLFKDGIISLLENRYAVHYKHKYKWGTHIDSIGYAYDIVCKIVFGSRQTAGKIMALAAFGNLNDDIPGPFIDDTKYGVLINPQWITYLDELPFPIGWDNKTAKDLAFSIQKALEKYIKSKIEHFMSKYNINNVVLGGGIGLNCKNNGIIANLPNINNYSVYCACGDSGLSLGAAIWGYRNIFQGRKRIEWTYGLGKKYMKSMPLIIGNIPQQIAELLIENKVVGIFQNGAEFGPRALGNRSILASPRTLEMKYYLNTLKGRELFRPFGGMILSKNLPRITLQKLASPYMLSAAEIFEHQKQLFPALIHQDGTIRLQIIDDNDENILCRNILSELEALSKDFIIINTSFNGQNEPIVETPEQAMRSAIKMGLDYVIIDGILSKIK